MCGLQAVCQVSHYPLLSAAYQASTVHCGFAASPLTTACAARHSRSHTVVPRVLRSTTAARYSSFWQVQTECLSRLYRSRLVTVAAIRGSCPAGGCILALCCDHRVMTSDGSIGLNEAALSMPVPQYWMLVLSRTVGWRRTEVMLQRGLLLSAQQAVQCGLVDEVVDDRAALLTAAEREAAERLRVPEAGRLASKRLMREELSQQWEAQWRSEADSSWTLLSSEETVKQIGRVLQRLSGKKEAKGQPQRQAKL